MLLHTSPALGRRARARVRARRGGRTLGAAVLLVAALAPPATAAKQPDGLYLTGYIERTSITTTRCKALVGNDVYLVDTVTNVYRRTLNGTGPVGKKAGKVTAQGQRTTTIERKVEGDSEYYRPYVNGPVVTTLGKPTSPWQGFVSRVTAGKKKGKQQYAMYVDFTAIHESLEVDLFGEVPKKGSSKTYTFDEPQDLDGDLDPDDEECTHSQTVRASGQITLGRR